MLIFFAALLGIVEGLTEFLPISSTGHLILVSSALGLKSLKGIESFEIAIQSGAILAVIVLYRQKIRDLLVGLLKGQSAARLFSMQIIVGFFPVALLGVFFGKQIKEVLFTPLSVISALFVGGIAMIALERYLAKSQRTEIQQVPNLKTAFGIGLIQCVALWPGTSRSMATLLGGRLFGLSAPAAAEFSFFLAIPTLLGAAAYDLLKHPDDWLQSDIPLVAWLLAFVMSFISAWIVIKWFIQFISRHSLEGFGWDRIALAIAYWFFID